MVLSVSVVGGKGQKHNPPRPPPGRFVLIGCNDLKAEMEKMAQHQAERREIHVWICDQDEAEDYGR